MTESDCGCSIVGMASLSLGTLVSHAPTGSASATPSRGDLAQGLTRLAPARLYQTGQSKQGSGADIFWTQRLAVTIASSAWAAPMPEIAPLDVSGQAVTESALEQDGQLSSLQGKRSASQLAVAMTTSTGGEWTRNPNSR